VGIVNAVEVVHAFPGAQGLRAFRDWLTAPDEELVQLARGKGGGRGRGRGRGQQQGQAGGQGGAGSPGGEGGGGARPGSRDERQAALMAEFKHKHRGVRRNWEPPPGFPSDAVAQAYAEPRVDTSKDK
jgi:DNA excision repair protein ERCC-5